MLIAASILSIVLGEYVDASAILAIVLLNAILGVVQESRAEEAFAALQKMAAPEAHVMRDGIRVTLPASELVLGILFISRQATLCRRISADQCGQSEIDERR